MTLNELESDKIERYFNGSYSNEDAIYTEEVFNCIDKEKDLAKLLHSQFYGLLDDQYELLDDQKVAKKNLDRILHKIHFNINSRLSSKKSWSVNSILKWSFRIASVIMFPIIILMGIQMFRETNLKNETWVEIYSPAWTRIQFSLPDGTTGWLNNNSSIKYNGNFNTDRQVILNGEAFFNVYTDKNRPFGISVNELTVTALGTEFNIAGYNDESFIEVVLDEGKLVISDSAMKVNHVMDKRELVKYDRNIHEIYSKHVHPGKYLAWTEGKLVFRDDPIDIIARRLGRWYDVDVEIIGNLPSDKRLRATFLDEDIEEVLGLLKRSLDISYQIIPGNLEIDGVYSKKKVILEI